MTPIPPVARRAVLTAALAGFLTLPLPRRALAATEVERVDDLIARTQAEEQALAVAQKDWAAREAGLVAERDHLGEA